MQEHQVDALYELEMFRALLERSRQDDSPEAVVRGLEREVEWWKLRAEWACSGGAM